MLLFFTIQEYCSMSIQSSKQTTISATSRLVRSPVFTYVIIIQKEYAKNSLSNQRSLSSGWRAQSFMQLYPASNMLWLEILQQRDDSNIISQKINILYHAWQIQTLCTLHATKCSQFQTRFRHFYCGIIYRVLYICSYLENILSHS